MAYFRHVIAEKLPFPVLSLAIDETRAVLRVLTPREGLENTEDQTEAGIADLSTTAKLASAFIQVRDKFYTIDGKEYCILAEGILDKTDPIYARSFFPGAHFAFEFDPVRGFFVDRQDTRCAGFRCHTAAYIKYKGGMWLFDLWVRNPDDPLTACNRSITTAPDTVLITNVDDLGEQQTAEYVMTGGVSHWLNLGYELTPSSETVAPDGWMTFTLRILDGKTGELATDVTWDGYVIEPVDGYCPHRRVSVVNGVGTFRMKALDLQDGETMRVKINTRSHTGRVEATVKVRSE